MGDRWVVSVRYDLKDLYAISWQGWRRWSLLLVWVLVAFLIIGVGFPLIEGMRFYDVLSEIDYFILVPLALIVIIIVAAAPAIQFWKRKKRGWDVSMLVKLDDEGISADFPMGSQLTFWKALQKIRATQDRLFLFTTPSHAYILPKRCFANEAEFQRWIEYSKRRWDAAKAINID